MSEKQTPVSVAIKQEGKMVVLAFDRAVAYVEIEPANCLNICEAMAAAAFECRDGVKPVGTALKAELVERHRDKLIPRVALMLAGMGGKSNGYAAEQIVSACLAEVF